MRLHTAAGALSQVGGQYIEEQAELARQAVRALDDQERELELEYGAWRLLRETLAEAEQEDAVHLGNALVRPVSERMADLTGGRYGDLAIGPGLDATGIELAGGERRFDGCPSAPREQIALLLRLSIAEALKTFVILDDQLTQSDPARMAWIRDLLSRVSEEIQVVVMTCHPEDYAVKGRRRNIVDLSSRVRRNPMSTARPRPDGANVSSTERRRAKIRIQAPAKARSVRESPSLPSVRRAQRVAHLRRNGARDAEGADARKTPTTSAPRCARRCAATSRSDEPDQGLRVDLVGGHVLELESEHRCPCPDVGRCNELARTAVERPRAGRA